MNPAARVTPGERMCMRISRAIMLTALLATPAAAQISTGNSERHSIIGARAAALADANVADAFDVGSMYWNPAGVAFLQQRSLVLNYALERILSNASVMTENVAVPLPQMGTWGMGIGFTLHHIGKAPVGNPLSGSDFRRYSLDIALAKTIVPSFGIGIGLNGHYAGTPQEYRWGGSSTFGIYYEPSPEVSYGIVYEGVGSVVQYPYEFDTVYARNGVSTENPTRTLQAGLTLRYPSSADRRMITLVLASQKVFGETGVAYKGGAEWFPVSFFVVRAGYWARKSSVAAKFGAGLRLGRIQLDYAISDGRSQPRFQQLSICFLTVNG